MSPVETVIAELDKNIANYVPDKSVRSLLGKVSFIGAIGPTATGKSTVTKEVVRIHPGVFKFVPSHTTRYPRRGESEQRGDLCFDGDNPETLRKLARHVQSGELVQAKKHDTTGHYYWTYPEDFEENAFAIMPILASEYDRLASPASGISFASQAGIMFTCRPEEWNARARLREGRLDNPLLAPRIMEGYSSLEWGLNQGDKVHWIDTSTTDSGNGSIHDSARAVIDIATNSGNYHGDAWARVMGEILLDHLQILGGSDIKL